MMLQIYIYIYIFFFHNFLIYFKFAIYCAAVTHGQLWSIVTDPCAVLTNQNLRIGHAKDSHTKYSLHTSHMLTCFPETYENARKR